MYYFAYGLNTNLKSMASRCPAAKSLGQCVALDHVFEFRVHADIREEEDGFCAGVLWEITDECLAELDILEGFPSYYTRKEVQVAHPYINDEEGNNLITAIAYIMNEQDGLVAPFESYYDLVAEGYREHGMSTERLEAAARDAYEFEISTSII